MSVRAQWEWLLRDAAGERAGHAAGPAFTGRFDAEEWLGERWRALAAQGVASAQLLHEGEPTGGALDLTRVAGA